MNNTDLYIALSLLVVALYLYCICEDNVVEGLLVGTIDDIKNKELKEFDKIENMELFFEKYQGIHDPPTPNEFIDDLKKCEDENYLQSNEEECLKNKRKSADELKGPRENWANERRELQVIWLQIEKAREVRDKLDKIKTTNKKLKGFKIEVMGDNKEDNKYKSKWSEKLIKDKFLELKNSTNQIKKTENINEEIKNNGFCPIDDKLNTDLEKLEENQQEEQPAKEPAKSKEPTPTQ